MKNTCEVYDAILETLKKANLDTKNPDHQEALDAIKNFEDRLEYYKKLLELHATVQKKFK